MINFYYLYLINLVEFLTSILDNFNEDSICKRKPL